MPDIASIAMPIQELTRKGVIFKWGEEKQTAFRRLRQWPTGNLGLTVEQESLEMPPSGFRCSLYP